MQTFKVRVAEIDAPEKAQPFGNQSERMLSEIFFKKQALVQHQDTDFDMNLIIYKTTVNRRNYIADQQLGVRSLGVVERQPAELSSACCIN